MTKHPWNQELSTKQRRTRFCLGILTMVAMGIAYNHTMGLENNHFNEYFGKYAIAFIGLIGIFMGYIVLISIIDLEQYKGQILVLSLTMLALGIVIGSNWQKFMAAILIVLVGTMVATISRVYLKGLVTTLMVLVSLYIATHLSVVVYGITTVFSLNIEIQAIMYAVYVGAFIIISVFGRKINESLLKTLVGGPQTLSEERFKWHLQVSGLMLYIAAVIISYTPHDIDALQILNESCITYFMIVELFGAKNTKERNGQGKH